MIKIDHLSKKFNDNVVLDDISLDIKKGDVVGIIGPSGTGKSTLLRCVNRLETPELGTVTIGDKTIDLSEKKPKDLLYLRQNTGMVFQRFNLDSSFFRSSFTTARRVATGITSCTPSSTAF